MESWCKWYLCVWFLWLPWILVTAQVPNITRVAPSRNILSPLSHRASIAVFGENFHDNINVKLTRDGSEVTEVNIIIINATSLHLETKDETSNTKILVGMTTQMVFVVGTETMGTGINVTFVEDPFIEKIEPLYTITSGGIHQTVTGRHFHNRALFMTIQLTCAKTHMIVDQQLCTDPVENGTKFFCPTPNLKNYKDVHGGCLYTSIYSPAKYEIMIFHGEPSMKQEIHVFRDPDSTFFGLKTFKPYKGDTKIEIYGHFLYTISTDYYSVTIGSATCDIINIYSNVIYCKPPLTRPPLDKDGAFPLVVTLGNYSTVAGYVRYELNAWENPRVKYGVIGGISGAVLLMLLVILIVKYECYWKELKMNYPR